MDVDALATELARRRDGRHLLLLLDFDGTLVPFHPDPGAVFLPAPLYGHLNALARHPRITVGIVSGRRLIDLQHRISIPGVVLAGLHGLEIDAPGERFIHPDAAGIGATIQRIAAAVQPGLAGMAGVFVEDKGLSIVLHYRDASPATADQAQSLFLAAARADVDAGRVRLLPGACVLELLPAVSWDKGHAVHWIRERVERAHGSTFAVYIGDDVTDEDAFRAIGPGGMAIVASGRARGAAFQLDGPEGVSRLLHSLDGSEDNGRA